MKVAIKITTTIAMKPRKRILRKRLGRKKIPLKVWVLLKWAYGFRHESKLRRIF